MITDRPVLYEGNRDKDFPFTAWYSQGAIRELHSYSTEALPLVCIVTGRAI